MEARRWQLLWLVHQPMSLTAAAKAVGINDDYARSIVNTYNREDADGVRNRRKDSRPQPTRSLLTAEQQQALAARLKMPPDDNSVWNGPKVARVMAEILGVPKVWPQRGWDYLKRLEPSLTVPCSRHRKGDPESPDSLKK